MNIRKIGVVLLALLLAGMVIVPMVSAEGSSSAMQTDEASADTSQVSTAGSRLMGPEYTIKNVDMSKEDFRKANAELIKFLLKTNNQSVVDQIMDTEYNRAYGKTSKTASAVAPMSINNIVQIGGNNIYIWPYSNTAMSTSSYSGSIIV